MDIRIHIERPEHYRAIRDVNEEAFDTPAEADLVDSLRRDEAFIPELSLVAEIKGEVVGHILFTRIDIVDATEQAHSSLALAPMAVRELHRGKGIGGALVREGLKRAAASGHGSVIVLGHESYYPRFGFVPASRYDIRAPFEVPDTAFMALELQPGALREVEGVVRYAKAFEGV